MAEPLTPAQKQALQEEKDRQIREREEKAPTTKKTMGEGKLKFKKGGMVKSSASKRADGCAQRGKTRGRMV